MDDSFYSLMMILSRLNERAASFYTERQLRMWNQLLIDLQQEDNL